MTKKWLICIPFVLILFLIGCSGDKSTSVIIVEKPTGEGENEEYEISKEGKAQKQVDLAMDVLEQTKWQENVKVMMIGEPEYQFYLLHTEKDGQETQSVVYYVWITPKEDQLEVIQRSENKYAKMSIENSDILHGILTGEILGE
ncbi:hypothetical protein ACOI1C_12130 [Bacillus sp. DJP31]|uniref:hypothetical protein n=1 Tax=Bacillus sp. DJP31 TaxID=3409789 RepID=UPI003BB7A6D7